MSNHDLASTYFTSINYKTSGKVHIDQWSNIIKLNRERSNRRDGTIFIYRQGAHQPTVWTYYAADESDDNGFFYAGVTKKLKTVFSRNELIDIECIDHPMWRQNCKLRNQKLENRVILTLDKIDQIIPQNMPKNHSASKRIHYTSKFKEKIS